MWATRGPIFRQCRAARMDISIHQRGRSISAIKSQCASCRSIKINRYGEIGMENGWKLRHRSENKRSGHMSRLSGKVIVTAQKKSDKGNKGNVIEDMDEALKQLGLTRENAKVLLKAWKEAVRLRTALALKFF